ncbi:MAG: TatD family hydrolase [Rickettsiales bacterium]|nr:MAG: TatD family hydrolase [Rickettsiales bacterium]
MKDFLIDSHCHLDMIEESGIPIAEIIANAVNNNVKIINTIGVKFDEFDKVIQYTQEYKEVYGSLGIHPEEMMITEIADIEELRKWVKKDKIIGVGECGLDYHYEGYDKVKQRKNFEVHIELARQENKPIIIHSRDADADMMDILKSEMKNGEFKFLLHSFTSGAELLKTGLDLGGYVSLSGITTFKNAEDVRSVIKNIPLSRLLIETDAPFLAPVPFRGKTNQPAYTKNTAEYLSDFFAIEYSEFQSITTENFLNLFSLDF